MLLEVIHYIMKNNIYKTIKNTIDRIELDPEKYRHTFVNPDKDFTRDRKQTLSSVVLESAEKGPKGLRTKS